MILNQQVLSFIGRPVFEKLEIKPPFQYKAIFPDEACFLHIKKGRLNLFSAEGSSYRTVSESLLLNCGLYIADFPEEQTIESTELIAIHLYPDLLNKLFYHEPPPGQLTRINKSNSSVSEISLPIIQYIQSLEFYFNSPEFATEEILSQKIRELVLLLLQTNHAPSFTDLMKFLFSPKQASFREIIQSHLFTSATQADLAALTGMSLSTFKREFGKIFKESPGAYLLNKQVEEAKKFLANSNLTVSEIAYTVGFQDPSNFSKIFRRKTGCSPIEFRKANTDELK